ncbi:hypothetical protein LCGC14_0249860 [marine sediment metagenome]|uniref:Uncharacterized protein n=1 Tax=marine sediment metagenome TaxID=412755 RepID=A0A0F9X9X3_9ZZZZ
MSSPKFPHITVQLSGENGNAFSIMRRVTKAMRRADVSKEDIDKFQEESMSGDYDNLMQVCMKTVDVE